MCHINLGVCSFTPPFVYYVHQQIQGTSLKIVGVDLETSSFPHGLLFVACCRVGSAEHSYLQVPTRRTKNIVYQRGITLSETSP